MNVHQRKSRKPALPAGPPILSEDLSHKENVTANILSRNHLYRAWPPISGKRLTITVADPQSRKALFQYDVQARSSGSVLLIPEIGFSKDLLR